MKFDRYLNRIKPHAYIQLEAQSKNAGQGFEYRSTALRELSCTLEFNCLFPEAKASHKGVGIVAQPATGRQ